MLLFFAIHFETSKCVINIHDNLHGRNLCFRFYFSRSFCFRIWDNIFIIYWLLLKQLLWHLSFKNMSETFRCALGIVFFFQPTSLISVLKYTMLWIWLGNFFVREFESFTFSDVFHWIGFHSSCSSCLKRWDLFSFFFCHIGSIDVFDMDFIFHNFTLWHFDLNC